MDSVANDLSGITAILDSDAIHIVPAPPGDDRYLAYHDNVPPSRTSASSNNDNHVDDEQREFEQQQLLVWHGSSMALLAKADALLRQEFTIRDPEKDFRKWAKLGARPYYFAIINNNDVGAVSVQQHQYQDAGQAPDSSTSMLRCCLRCLLDGDWDDVVASAVHNCSSNDSQPSNDTVLLSTPSSSALSVAAALCNTSLLCRRRLVVDYLVTRPEYQGRGYASHLLRLARQVATTYHANCYVIAHEDASVYWMEKGFVLVQENSSSSSSGRTSAAAAANVDDSEGPLHRRLNPYDDSFLLQLPSNQPEDPAFIGSYDSSSSSSSDGSSSSSSSSDGDDDDDDPSSSSSSASSPDEFNNDEDEKNLQKAIMESLNMK